MASIRDYLVQFLSRADFSERLRPSWGLKIRHLAPNGSLKVERVLRSTGYTLPQEISLESGHSIHMVPVFFEGVQVRVDRQMAYSFCAAILANIFVVLSLGFSFRVHDPYEFHHIDLAKVQVTLSSLNSLRPQAPGSPQDAAAVAQARETRQAARLMKAWGVGKPISNANQVLKPSVYDKTFSKSEGTKGLNSWALSADIDDDQLDKPLNLSEDEVARALRSVASELRECYNRALIHDTTLKGKPQVVVDINLSGRVSGVQLVGLTARDSSISQLRSCFLSAYKQVALRTPNQAFVVTQTMVLDY